MKRLGLLVIVLMLALSVIPLSAMSAEEVVSLARYYPVETPFFFAMRTDDAFVEKGLALVKHIAQFTPEDEMVDELTLDFLYEQEMMPGVTFGESIRPWLGDLMAIGITGSVEQAMARDDPPMLIALSVTDRAAAEAFVTKMMELTGGTDFNEPETRGGFTVYLPKDEYVDMVLAIGDDMVFISNSEDALPLTARESSLVDNPQATAIVSMMPLSDYDMVMYVDMSSFIAATMEQAAKKNADDPEAAAFIDVMQPFMGVYAPVGMGIVLNDRMVGMDVVQLIGDTSAFEEAGFTLNYPTVPVDLNFAEVVPADANLVMMGANVGAMTKMGLDNLRAFGDFIQDNGILKDLALKEGADPDEAEYLDNLDLGQIVTFIDFGFAGMTGLNLENDVLAWMEGDAAGYLRVLPSEETVITVDAALVTETNDADATRTAVTKLGEALKQYDFAATEEVTGPRQVVVLTGVLQKLLPPRMLNRIGDVPDLDILIGTNGTVAAVGTRPAVQYSLNPDGPGLAGDPAFVAAQDYFLPDSQGIFYMNLQPLEPVLEQMSGARMALSERILFQLLESISMTGKMSEESQIGRLVITFNDAE